MEEEQSTICGFLSNIQGDYDKFCNYVEISRILTWENEDKSGLQLADNAIFVFGGNVQGIGIGDIRIVRILLDLKKKYPNRVKLLIGSKDILALKFADLSDEALAKEAPKSNASIPTGSDGNASDRVRWLLRILFDSDAPFELRRAELALLSADPDSRAVSEIEVAQSFTEQVRPGEAGLMLRYLEEAQLAHIFDTTLIVHGGVPDGGAGAVPGHEPIARSRAAQAIPPKAHRSSCVIERVVPA